MIERRQTCAAVSGLEMICSLKNRTLDYKRKKALFSLILL